MVLNSVQVRHKCVEDRLPLVGSIARSFLGRGLEYGDLFQAGCVGLLQAEKYSKLEGNYASKCIKSEILRALREESRTIRLPKHERVKHAVVQRKINELAQELGRRPSTEEIEQRIPKMGWDSVPDILRMGRRQTNEETSVDHPRESEEASEDEVASFKLFIVSPDWPRLFAALNEEKAMDAFTATFDFLPLRWRQILKLRCGLDGEAPLTQEETAKFLGMSRRRTLQDHERKALKFLRSEMEKSSEQRRVQRVLA